MRYFNLLGGLILLFSNSVMAEESGTTDTTDATTTPQPRAQSVVKVTTADELKSVSWQPNNTTLQLQNNIQLVNDKDTNGNDKDGSAIYISRKKGMVVDGQQKNDEQGNAVAGGEFTVTSAPGGTLWAIEGDSSQWTNDSVADLTFQNITLDGVKPKESGVFKLNYRGTLDLNNVKVDGITRAEASNAVWGGIVELANNGRVRISNSTFSNVDTQSKGNGPDSVTGGVIYVQGDEGNVPGASVISIIDKSTFEGNKLTSLQTTDAYGGAIYVEGRLDKVINSKFEKNSVQVSGDKTIAYGGAIAGGGIKTWEYARRGAAVIGVIGDLTQFNENFVLSEKGDGYGGAIYSSGLIEEFIGTQFKENYVNAVNGYGGAIASTTFAGVEVCGKNSRTEGCVVIDAADIALIRRAVFDGNYVSATNAARGGAVYTGGNSDIITGFFYNNHANGVIAQGGALYNAQGKMKAPDDTSQIKDERGFVDKVARYISGLFSGNYAQGQEATGGALYNEGIINNIKMIPGYENALNAEFKGNYAVALDKDGNELKNGKAMGGAIYNNGTIKNLKATFENNYVKGALAHGGALASSKTIKTDEDGNEVVQTGIIENIEEAYFTNNAAISNAADGEAKGGALFSLDGGVEEGKDDIGTIKAYFTGNHASAANMALGGGVYNNGIIGEMTSTFYNNHVNAAKALGGALANTKEGAIRYITSEFTNNYAISEATENDAEAKGGALYSREGALNGEDDIAKIDATFTGNYASAKVQALGGAVYNNGVIGEMNSMFENNYVNGDIAALGGALANTKEGVIQMIEKAVFKGNYAITEAEKGIAKGGALYNLETSTTVSEDEYDIGNLYATFENNYVYASKANAVAQGGGVYNEGKINNIQQGDSADTIMHFSGNYAKTIGDKSVSRGGAISNKGKLGNIIANFVSNVAESACTAFGGAVHNEGSTADTSGLFATNYVSGTDEAFGGAIYNSATLTSIGYNDAINLTSVFDGNYAEATTEALGGAIYNSAKLGNIKAQFLNNKVDGNRALGGAIYNTAELGNIAANFSTNTAQGDVAMGGAIYTTAATLDKTISGTFDGNVAVGKTSAFGGAVLAMSDSQEKPVVFVNSEFINNKAYLSAANATRAATQALGGAVYGNALKFVANGAGENTSFQGNTAGDTKNAIYVAGLESLGLGEDKAAKVEFAALEGGKVQVYDDVDGVDYDILISGDDKAGSEVVFYGTVDNAQDTVLAANTLARLGGDAVFNTEGYSALEDSKMYLDGKMTAQKYSVADGSQAEIKGKLEATDYKALGGSLTNVSGMLDATDYQVLGNSITNVIGTLNADKYQALDNSTTHLTGTLYASDYSVADSSITNITGTLNADKYQALDNSTTHLTGTITAGKYFADAGSLMHLGKDALITADSYEAVDGTKLQLDLAINNKIPDNGMIKVNGDVKGTTTVYVNLLSDSVPFEGILAKFVEASEDEVNTAAAFEPVVLANSYQWKSVTNKGGETKGNTWYLTIEGKDNPPVDPENPDDDPTKPKPDDPTNPDNPVNPPVNPDDPTKPKPDDPNKPDNPVNPPVNPDDPNKPKPDDPNKPNPGEDEDKPNKPNKPNKPVVPSNPVYRAEVAAYTALQTIAVEQNRSIANSVAKGLASKKSTLCYQETCGIAELMPKKEAWIDMTYENAKIDTPAEIDAKISGTTLGIDFYRLGNERAGLFGAYRHGKYDLSGEGRYYAKTGADVTNKSWLGGAYYQYDDTAWKVLGTVFAGKQKMDIKTDDRLAFADTDAKQYGASAEVSKHFELTDEISLSPSLGLYYTTLDIDTIHDNLRKQAKFDTLHYLEAEAGVAVEYVSCHDGNTRRVYVKPSVIKTFADGGKTRMGDINKPLDTFEERTLGRLELGGNFGLNDQWNGYAETGYTFGDDYKAYDFTVGIGYRF